MVTTGGDSVLAEFASVVDAVRRAVGIEEELKNWNTELPKEKGVEFRIGVNPGYVVEEGGNILGDGVNVAARIQGLAECQDHPFDTNFSGADDRGPPEGRAEVRLGR